MLEELEELELIYQSIVQFLVNYSFQILGAVIILIIGFMLSRRVSRAAEKLMVSKLIDVTLSRFVANSLHIIVLVMIGIVALDQLGISITPLIAAVGAISLGAGLALQGMLANYAAGFTIIITRPFVVDDTIHVQGVTGLVEKVTLPYTILVDEDQVRIQIPNRLVVGEILHNSQTNKLIELAVGVAYQSDPRQVIDAIRTALWQVEGVTEDPKPLIGIAAYGDSSIDFGIRFWAPTEKHFETLYAANLAIYDELKTQGIQIPFPQREVRVLNGQLENDQPA